VLTGMQIAHLEPLPALLPMYSKTAIPTGFLWLSQSLHVDAVIKVKVNVNLSLF